MDRIFSNARSAIVWLGELSERDIEAGSWWNRRTVIIGSALQNTDPCCHERAWVTQESVLDRRRHICAGAHLFDYRPKDFFRLVSKADRAYSEDSEMYKDFRGGNRIQALARRLDRMNALGDYQIQEKQTDKPDMFYYQKTFRNLPTSATNPRDQVYSLLSLTKADEARIIGSDYSITTSQVFAKATYASFIVRKNFDMLLRADLRRHEHLPS